MRRLLIPVAAGVLLMFPAMPNQVLAHEGTCAEFTYQEDAQAHHDADPDSHHHLDESDGSPGDDIACGHLPHRSASGGATATGSAAQPARPATGTAAQPARPATPPATAGAQAGQKGGAAPSPAQGPGKAGAGPTQAPGKAGAGPAQAPGKAGAAPAQAPVGGAAPGKAAAAPAQAPRGGAAPTALPRTGGLPIEGLLLLGTAIVGTGVGIRRFFR